MLTSCPGNRERYIGGKPVSSVEPPHLAEALLAVASRRLDRKREVANNSAGVTLRGLKVGPQSIVDHIRSLAVQSQMWLALIAEGEAPPQALPSLGLRP
jgi:hypothetical protein